MESKLLIDIYHHYILSGKDVRFTPESYGFVLAGLDFYRSKCGVEGHIEAEDLVEAVCDLGALKFGPMAETVFEHWGVTRPLDIGAIVYNLIDLDILSKTPDDKLEQFDLGDSLKNYLKQDEIYKIDKKMIKMLRDA